MSKRSPFGILFGLVVSAIVLSPVIAMLAVAGLLFYFFMKDNPIVAVILAPIAGAGSIFAVIRWMNRRAVKGPTANQDAPPDSP